LCRLGQDRTPYFIDEGHLSVAGAKVTLRLLVGPIAGAVRAAPMGAQTLAETRAKGASAASRSILSSR